MSPYREKYHRELDDLKMLTEKLGEEVRLAVEKSVVALKESDWEMARDVISGDQAADDLNEEIESMCMELLALQQPMAKDLRMIIGILKIGIDLERIGDLAVDIARVAVQHKDKIHITKLEYIPRMADVNSKMLALTMEALVKGDADLARQTTKWDYDVDGLYVRARDKILKIIIEDPEVLESATALLLVNRHLERVGDHICNICEAIVYIVEAKKEHLN